MKIGDIFDLAELLACLDSWSCILAAAVLYLDALAERQEAERQSSALAEERGANRLTYQHA